MRFRVALLFVGLLIAAAAVARADRRETIPPRTSFDVFPLQIGEWRGVQQPAFEDDVLAVLGVDDYLTRAYFTPARRVVGLYVGYWRSQRQSDTIHSPQNCLPGAGWEPVSWGGLATADPRNPAGVSLSVNRIVIQKGLERQLVLYWYQSQGRIVASEYWSKFFLVKDAVRTNRTDGAIVRIIVPIPGGAAEALFDGEGDAERTAMEFMNQLVPLLDGFLPR